MNNFETIAFFLMGFINLYYMFKIQSMRTSQLLQALTISVLIDKFKAVPKVPKVPKGKKIALIESNYEIAYIKMPCEAERITYDGVESLDEVTFIGVK